MSHLCLFSTNAVLYPFLPEFCLILNEQALITIFCDIATQLTHKSFIILFSVFQKYINKAVNLLECQKYSVRLKMSLVF